MPLLKAPSQCPAEDEFADDEDEDSKEVFSVLLFLSLLQESKQAQKSKHIICFIRVKILAL